MNSIQTEELRIKTPEGVLYAKKWVPVSVCSDVPVILFHDSLGSVDLWRDFPEILASELSRCVIAYDRPGYGKSDARDTMPGLSFIQDEATGIFPHLKDALSLQRFILLGYSVGGPMALVTAAIDPDCVAIITQAAQVFVEERTLKGIREARQRFEQPGQIERLEKWHGRKASWVLRAWTDTWLSPEFSEWNLDSYLGKVNCPVLAIHGEQDEFGSTAFPEFIAGNVSGASETLILPNCGHAPHREKTQEVVQRIASFLDRHRID